MFASKKAVLMKVAFFKKNHDLLTQIKHGYSKCLYIDSSVYLMNNRSGGRAERERERKTGWGRKVHGDDFA